MVILIGKKAKELIERVDKLEKELKQRKITERQSNDRITELSRVVVEHSKEIDRLKGLDASIKRHKESEPLSQDEIFDEWFNGKKETKEAKK